MKIKRLSFRFSVKWTFVIQKSLLQNDEDHLSSFLWDRTRFRFRFSYQRPNWVRVGFSWNNWFFKILDFQFLKKYFFEIRAILPYEILSWAVVQRWSIRLLWWTLSRHIMFHHLTVFQIIHDPICDNLKKEVKKSIENRLDYRKKIRQHRQITSIILFSSRTNLITIPISVIKIWRYFTLISVIEQQYFIDFDDIL